VCFSLRRIWLRQFFANINHNIVRDDHPDLSSDKHFGHGWHPDSDRHANRNRHRYRLLSGAHASRRNNTKHLDRGDVRDADHCIRANELHDNSIEFEWFDDCSSADSGEHAISSTLESGLSADEHFGHG
jgi:hypothetical protein